MAKNGLWVALALLALVGGGIGYLLYQDSQPPAEAPVSENKLFPGGLKELDDIRLERPGEPAIAVRGNEAAGWRIESPASFPADAVAVGDLVGLLRTLEAERTIDAEGTSPQDFGLQSPMLRFALREGQQEHILEFGGVNPTGSARYARRTGSTRLFLVGMATVNALSKTLGDLRQKKVIDATEFQARRIRLEGAAATRELIRKDGRDWTFTDPPDFAADQRLMGEIVNQVISLRTDAAALNGDSLPETRFRALPLYARIRVATEAAELEAELRGAPGAVYARSASLGGIYPVPAEIDNFLRKPLAEFRDLRIFRFGFSDVFKLNYDGGGVSLALEKPNENWLLAGRKTDASAANTLVDELRGATAAEYREGNPPGEVTHTIRVETSDGREERVRLHKADEAIFAVRDGEKGYYRLPEGFLTGLEKAASALNQ